MSSRAYIAGVGMIPFVKPGANAPYHVMGAEAAKLALGDAGLDYGRIQQAYVGYVYGDSTCGQRALYSVGMTGIPIVNVNNNCSTGSTALFLARQAIESGAAECVLALGFEQMKTRRAVGRAGFDGLAGEKQRGRPGRAVVVDVDDQNSGHANQCSARLRRWVPP